MGKEHSNEVIQSEETQSYEDPLIHYLYSGTSEAELLALNILATAAKPLTPIELHTEMLLRQDLYTRFENPHGLREDAGWRIKPESPIAYVRNSFMPNHLVLGSYYQDTLNEFMINPFFQDSAAAFTGLLLGLSYKFGSGFSLETFIGSSHGNKAEESLPKVNRAISLGIDLYIREGRVFPVRTLDFANFIGCDPALVGRALGKYHQAGYVDYQTAPKEKGSAISHYSIAADEPTDPIPVYFQNEELTLRVYSLLKFRGPNAFVNLPEFTRLVMAHPLFEEKNFESFQSEVSGVLAILRRNGFVQVRDFDETTQGLLSVPAYKIPLFTEFSRRLQGYTKRDMTVMQEGRDASLYFQQNPFAVRSLMEKARNASSHANALSAVAIRGHLLGTIQQNPNSTAQELASYLQERTGRPYDYRYIHKRLHELQDAEAIETTANGRILRFRPASHQWVLNPKGVLRDGIPQYLQTMDREKSIEWDPAAITTILFDLDEALIAEDDSTNSAFSYVDKLVNYRYHTKRYSFMKEARQRARTLWHTGPFASYCEAMGISSSEGLAEDTTPSLPQLQELKLWLPEYQQRVWNQSLAYFGFNDPGFARILSENFQKERRWLYVPHRDVLSVLPLLQEKYQLGLVTNGLSDLQRYKLEHARLTPFFQKLFISTEVGFGKPDPRIFLETLFHFHLHPHQVLMVGDSKTSDIQGAQQLGMQTILIDRKNTAPKKQRKTYQQIASLQDMLSLLGKNRS